MSTRVMPACNRVSTRVVTTLEKCMYCDCHLQQANTERVQYNIGLLSSLQYCVQHDTAETLHTQVLAVLLPQQGHSYSEGSLQHKAAALEFIVQCICMQQRHFQGGLQVVSQRHSPWTFVEDYRGNKQDLHLQWGSPHTLPNHHQQQHHHLLHIDHSCEKREPLSVTVPMLSCSFSPSPFFPF